MDLVEFYKNNSIDIDLDFDEHFYQNEYPDLSGYYLPWAKDNGFSERQRLFHHYYLYGKKEGRFSSLKDKIAQDKIIFIKPTQGLSNRLLLIDSAYAFAKINNFNKIKLCWSFSEGFSDESFEELFDVKSLPEDFYLIDDKEYEEASLNFLNLNTCVYQDKESLKYIFNTDRGSLFEEISTASFCHNYFASLDWIFEISLPERNLFIKKYIRPNKKLIEEIESLQIKQDYVGLHIRRGDAINSPWSDYFNQSSIESFRQIAKDSRSKIFLSTDCEETQKEFLEKHSDKIIVNKNKKFVDKNITINDRKNYQKDAVIDLFCLSKTRKLFGTNWSTFSQVASIIGSNQLEITKKNPLSYAPILNLSAVVGLKNRSRVLQTSINSWLMKPEIKEIIIVDCSSSDFDSNYFESLDKRIRTIRLGNEEYFNLSKVYNVGIENCTYENILKLDVDYILNPYVDLCDWLNFDLESEFLTGHWEDESLDGSSGFLSYLNGFLCAKKDNIINAGLYQGNQHGYGYDDCDLYSRLEKLGLSRQRLKFGKNFAPIFHIPHGDYFRTENYKEKDYFISLEKNIHEKKSQTRT
jgi:hypothetical protein